VRFTDVGRAIVVASNAGVTGTKAKEGASVHTSFGPIELSDVGGTFEVEGSNSSIKARGLRGSGRLKTSFGTVKAQLPEGLGYTVDARTSFGSIESELPVAGGQQSGNVLTGKIGDGRCPLTVVNSNGRINLVVAR
jgi:hypothetical protein